MKKSFYALLGILYLIFSLWILITIDVFDPTAYKWNIFIYENSSKRIGFPKLYFRTHQIVWLLKIDFPSPCGLYMQFLFSKGKHLQSIDELLFVYPTVTEATQWQRPH